MAVPTSMSDLLTEVDKDTTAVGVVVLDLRAQVKTGMSQADVDAVNAKLTDIGGHLTAIAADPNAPIPPAVTKFKKP